MFEDWSYGAKDPEILKREAQELKETMLKYVESHKMVPLYKLWPGN
jgi:hypothetical protein